MLRKNRQWQKKKCEDQFGDILQKDTVLSLNWLPPSSRIAPTHSHVCPMVLPPLLKTPPPKCHTWAKGKSYAQPDTHLLVDQMTNMFLGICWLQQLVLSTKAGVSVTQDHVNYQLGALDFSLGNAGNNQVWKISEVISLLILIFFFFWWHNLVFIVLELSCVFVFCFLYFCLWEFTSETW